MGYLHIDNLYRAREILLFRECYALEKIHGTSAHIAWRNDEKAAEKITLFLGGAKQATFDALFDVVALREKFLAFNNPRVVIYGEAYGGKMEGMSATYGDKLRFVAFDVMIGESWLDVPDAADVANQFGLEFVAYEKVSTDMESLDLQRGKDSTQAVRNGMGTGHAREGVVLRPLIELKKKNGDRVIAKYKLDSFEERANPPKVLDAAKMKVLSDAEAVATEWVTPIRLAHVLDHLGLPGEIERTGDVIRAMIEDVTREAAGEIVDSKEVRTAIGKKTAAMFKERVRAI